MDSSNNGQKRSTLKQAFQSQLLHLTYRCPAVATSLRSSSPELQEMQKSGRVTKLAFSQNLLQGRLRRVTRGTRAQPHPMAAGEPSRLPHGTRVCLSGCRLPDSRLLHTLLFASRPNPGRKPSVRCHVLVVSGACPRLRQKRRRQSHDWCPEPSAPERKAQQPQVRRSWKYAAPGQVLLVQTQAPRTKQQTTNGHTPGLVFNVLPSVT